MVRDLLSLIYPSVCINCNLSLISEEKFLCTKCKIDLPFTNDSFLHDNELSEKFTFNPLIKGAASLLHFQKKGATQKLLHKLKYNGYKEIGRLLGGYFSDSIADLEVDFILPVPVHARKMQKRGFNQSTEIAIGISEKISLDIREDVITRKAATSSQTKKSKVERWSGLENVYSEASKSVKNQKVLVIDDVITTGATVGMLCDRLAEKGVAKIYVGSIARGT